MKYYLGQAETYELWRKNANSSTKIVDLTNIKYEDILKQYVITVSCDLSSLEISVDTLFSEIIQLNEDGYNIICNVNNGQYIAYLNSISSSAVKFVFEEPNTSTTYTIVIDNVDTVTLILNQLSNSIQSITEYTQSIDVSVNDSYDTAISKLRKIIIDNEYISAAALNDLNVRKLDSSLVPTKLSDFINDTNYVIDASYNHTDNNFTTEEKILLSNITIEDISQWNHKQDVLVSGTNIKTINNDTLLGNGNIETVKVYDVSSNIFSNDSTVKRAACEELYEAINNGCICKLFDVYYATKQMASQTSDSKTINLSFDGAYAESPGLIIHYSLNAFYDQDEDSWWVSPQSNSYGIYNLQGDFMRINGTIDTTSGIISAVLYNNGYISNSNSGIDKIILHLNNSTGITSDTVLQITAQSNNTTYEGSIYVMQNGQYTKLSADMFTESVDIPLIWYAPSTSSTSGTWYSFMSFDSNINTLQSYITGGNYNSANKKIYLTHDSSVISEIDATAFIKDGMINDVSIIDSSMVITFNTDAGKEDIELNMHQIFNPSIYYTKTEIDNNFVLNASIQNLDKVPYVIETAAANVTIEPYKMYDFGTVSITMNIAFDTTKEVNGYTKEYIIRFTAEAGCTVVLPNTVLYANRNIPNYTAGHIYEITIVNNCAVVAEFY